MDPRFEEIISNIDKSLHDLLNMAPTTFLNLPKDMPEKGVYLFSEGEYHLYVGRSNFIRKRLHRHCSPGATHRMAAFAFRLARESTGNMKASYKQEGSRSDLMANPTFVSTFEAAKERIRKMDVRFVGESDPVKQAILEIYVSVALQTPYNDFDNH